MHDHYHEAGLVPSGLGASAVAPFIELTLATLGLLGLEPAVQQYSQADPDAHRAIRALSTQVAEAGIRVRDTAKNRDMFDEHMRMFTPEEYWKFNLAVDVIAMFATGGGLRSDTHVLIINDLGILDEHAYSHHWKSQVHKAGDGPAEFRELRAHIPHHKPRPSWG
jgi:hypothetical protein